MAACLSGQGNYVVGVDVNPIKTRMLNSGESPIVEPEVSGLLSDAHSHGLLCATGDSAQAIAETQLSFISVGTPSLQSGKVDLRAVEQVCNQIGTALHQKTQFHTVVLRSTMPPGSAEHLAIPALERSSGKRAGVDFAVCSNPEFLREGSAVRDFMQPPMTVLGAASPIHLDPLVNLYAFATTPLFKTNLATAEMVKYACNSFHALKVAFANEIATLGREAGVDIDEVARIYCSDTKLNISAAYLKPGFAFGGSCLPKDVRAITHQAKQLDLELPLLQSILPSNEQHIERAIQAVLRTGKRNVALLGLSFKGGTDDLRESPYVQLAKRLIGEGCSLRIWDNDVSLGFLVGSNRQFIMDVIPHIGALLSERREDVVAFGDVVIIGTPSVRASDLELKPGQVVFDFTRMSQMVET
jgi:GDP-mannose 6-dehydrogenase